MKKVLVLGAGALGSNLVANLASDLRNEVEITVLDYDTVEERNVQAGTQFYMPDQIGQLKVEALQYNVYKWFGKEIHIDSRELEFANEIYFDQEEDNPDLTIDCFDNNNARQLVQDAWKNYGHVPTLHCGFSSKMTFEISWADNYEVPDDNPHTVDVCEMQGAGSFIKMVSAVASRTVMEFVTTGEKKYFIGNRFSVRPVV